MRIEVELTYPEAMAIARFAYQRASAHDLQKANTDCKPSERVMAGVTAERWRVIATVFDTLPKG